MSGTENKYWISRERYLELKHFCYQYPSWVKNYLLLTNGIDIKSLDPTSDRAISIAEYERVIALVRKTAESCGEGIFEHVTYGAGYSGDWKLVRRFYYILSVKKGF